MAPQRNTNAQTAIDRVKNATGANDIAIVPDAQSGKEAFILRFDSPEEAGAFSAKTGGTIVGNSENKFVWVSQDKAQSTFNDLGIGEHGRTQKHEMTSSLKYELEMRNTQPAYAPTQNTQNIPSTNQGLIHQSNSTTQRVLDGINQHLQVPPQRLSIKEDINKAGQNVIKLDFPSQEAARAFAEAMSDKDGSQPPIKGNSVFVGPDRANHLFNRINMPGTTLNDLALEANVAQPTHTLTVGYQQHNHPSPEPAPRSSLTSQNTVSSPEQGALAQDALRLAAACEEKLQESAKTQKVFTPDSLKVKNENGTGGLTFSAPSPDQRNKIREQKRNLAEGIRALARYIHDEAKRGTLTADKVQRFQNDIQSLVHANNVINKQTNVTRGPMNDLLDMAKHLAEKMRDLFRPHKNEPSQQAPKNK